jgi:hypothetical protein
MNKSKRKRGKHDRSKRREYISKERNDSDCYGASNLVSNLETEESNSDNGRMVLYFYLKLHSSYTVKLTVRFLCVVRLLTNPPSFSCIPTCKFCIAYPYLIGEEIFMADGKEYISDGEELLNHRLCQITL